MRSSRRRYPRSTRTSYPGAGDPQDTRDTGPSRGRRASRCRSRGPLYRPCGSWATWAYTVSDAPSRPERRARLQRTSARPTSSKGMSARSGRTSCGSPTFPRKREVPPSYVRVFSGWVYVAFVTDVYSRRIIGWQTTYRPARTDLALDALRMAVWQRKRTGADLSGLVHHLRPGGAVPSHSLRGSPGRLRGSRLGGPPGRLLSAARW